MRSMANALLVAVIALAAVSLSMAQTQAPPSGDEHSLSFTADDLAQRALHRRAVEAVIWGMPAVNFERMLDAAIANGAKLNQVVYWSRPVNWKNPLNWKNPQRPGESLDQNYSRQRLVHVLPHLRPRAARLRRHLEAG
jgi:hypothetical protein